MKTPATKEQLQEIEEKINETIKTAIGTFNLSSDEAEDILDKNILPNSTKINLQSDILSLKSDGKLNNRIVEKYLSNHISIPINKQVERLRELYPQFKNVEINNKSKELPAGAEGFFAIPNIWKENPILNGSYSDIVWQMLEITNEVNKLTLTDIDRQNIGYNLRQSENSKTIFEKISKEQNHSDFLIIPAQFGIMYRGRSVNWTNKFISQENQFGLGLFAVGIMLLTHPEQLNNGDKFSIDCPGDEYHKKRNFIKFNCAPYFSHNYGRLILSMLDNENDHVGSGSATGFY